MIQEVLHFLGSCLIFGGCIFVLTTIAGFVKFKDPFKMMHVGGVCDLMGIPMIMLGCGFVFASRGNFDALFKVIFIIVMIYITSPISTNAISESACRIYNYIFLGQKDDEDT